MAKKQGICKNVDGCTLAADKTIQEVESTQFVCEECGKPLYELKGHKNKGPKEHEDDSRIKRILLYAGVPAAVIALGVGAFFLFGHKGEESGQEELIIQQEDTVVDEVKEDETISVPEESLVIPVTRVQIAPAAITLKESDVSDLMVGVFPEEATDKTVAWTTSDESVVVVSNTGHIVAMAAGQAQVHASVGDVTATCEVTVEPKKEKDKPVYPSIGTFAGTIIDGYPHGTGVLIFTKSRKIDTHDEKGRIAEVGDYINGEWDHGHLIQGKWYDSKNQVKGVISIGKAGNPEADRKLGRVKAR